jgi:hypothetical protein
MGWSLSRGPITGTYVGLEQIPILGSTSNAVSLKSYRLGASVPDILVGRHWHWREIDYLVRIDIGDWL